MSVLAGVFRTASGRAATLVLVTAFLAIFAVETTCQLVALVQLRRLDAARDEPGHYFQTSANSTLGYELKRNFSFAREGRRLHINKSGIREDSDERFADKHRVAILGDSVVFGIGLSQDQTISAFVQEFVDPEIRHTKLLNCGLPGLGLAEMREYLRLICAEYVPHDVVYVLNPNDFVTRDTQYEGADNGLYRTYRRPGLKSPWVIRKLLYRLRKGGLSPTTSWYRWTFEGTKLANLSHLRSMAAVTKAAGSNFEVVLLPVRDSFNPLDRTIPDIYREVREELAASGIPVIDPTPDFETVLRNEQSLAALIDGTDHLTARGSRVLAARIAATLHGGRRL